MSLPNTIKPVSGLKIEYVSTTSIVPRQRNLRKHSKKDVRDLARAIEQYGFNIPLVADESLNLVCGSARLAAAKLLGLPEVPVTRISHLTQDQLRQFAIAEDQFAQRAGWDRKVLAEELQELREVDPSLDFSLLGFEPGEVEVLIDDLEVEPLGEHSEPSPPDRQRPAISKSGDLWQLGRNRLLCGSALDGSAYGLLLDGHLAQMVFTDPPYNVKIEGNVGGQGAIKHPDFMMAVGEMTVPAFTQFLGIAFGHIVAYSIDGAIAYVCMDWRHIGEVIDAAKGIFTETKNLCVWNKTNAGLGAFYRSKHELIFAFKVGTKPHINNFSMGQYGRHRTNVWDYAGATAITRERLEDLALHPTVKPVALVADAIRDCSRRDGIILDPFAGSGTTTIAAEITGRRCFSIELDPHYVDTVIRRWQKLTAEAAVRLEDGRTFDQLVEATGGQQNG